ncbi:hypothetical protein GCM10023340_20290 [Nocardioides marinquilinus]|uniref:VWFA domain-containing protein n=1 Tax=Nocardioides marinquilinus TaxID=1210400 RepID=A0ABP9PJC4_9ACTN
MRARGARLLAVLITTTVGTSLAAVPTRPEAAPLRAATPAPVTITLDRAPAQHPSRTPVTVSGTSTAPPGSRAVLDYRSADRDRWIRVDLDPTPRRLSFSAFVDLGPTRYRVAIVDGKNRVLARREWRTTGVPGLTVPRPRVGQSFRVMGYVPDDRTHRPATLEQYVGGRWRPLARARATHRVSFPVRLTRLTSLRIRIGGFVSPTVVVDPLLPVRHGVDTDDDGLPDYVEQRFGSGRGSDDADHDGLDDRQELLSQTDPRLADTDGDGLADARDDTDADGLSNLGELRGGSRPDQADTDGDTLDDRRERRLGTSATDGDTDGDGAADADELAVGSDPRTADTDGDGVADGDETDFEVTVESPVLGVTVEATGPAEEVAGISVAAVEQGPLTDDATGYLSTPVDVEVEGDDVTATVAVEIDPATVPEGHEVALAHLGDGGLVMDLPAGQTYDPDTGVLTAQADDFSPFVAVDLTALRQLFSIEIKQPREGSGEVASIDAVLAIDSSGSMVSNDPEDLRLDASKEFVGTLLDGDRAGVVDFDSAAYVAQGLTTDFDAVRAAIDLIDSSGGTDIGAAVSTSLGELDAQSDGRGRVVVLLTDGDGDYDEALTERAVATRTTIYTVGLGSGVNTTLLDDIATSTGGKFFYVGDADDLADAYDRIGDAIGVPDTDGDGISDDAETNGWHTSRGSLYRTDPAEADTDGDGLTDGQEAGALVSNLAGSSSYRGVSDPTRVDTDGDHGDDYIEREAGTSPLLQDTDGDGLTDFRELAEYLSDPLSADHDHDGRRDDQEVRDGTDPYLYDLSGLDRVAAVSGGYLFGDWQWGAEHVGGLSVDVRESGEYLLGQFVSGVLVVGDVRDIVANIGTGDFGTALWTAVGFVPGFGDGAKFLSTVAKFATRSKRGARAAVWFNRFFYRSQKIKDVRRSVRSTITSNRTLFRLVVDTSAPVKRLDLRHTWRNEGYLSKGYKAINIVKNGTDIGVHLAGVSEVRWLEPQVDYAGRQVGANRVNLQYNYQGRHYVVQFFRPLKSDPGSAKRIQETYVRLLSNDPKLSEDQIKLELKGTPQ